jgi:single-stranded DNA-binding protein
MNSCILMAQIIKEPELRYTPDNQVPLAQMLVQFPALKSEDSPATLRVVGWGELAKEIQENFHEGDRVIIQGRLQINSVDRPEGFKEKRAELTVSKIYKTGEDTNFIAPSPQPSISSISPTPAATSSATTFTPTTSSNSPEPDLDDIPF